MENDDTIVEETPFLDVHDSDSSYESEPEDNPTTRRALCKFCKKTLAADGPSNGTSSLHRHYPCPKHPDYVPKTQKQQQTILEFKKNASGEACNGRVVLPSRHKLSRDVSKYYLDERSKLLAYLSKSTTTIHLTTDSWTSSCQRTNYMVVTAHFIDDDWNMHKRIINFRPIESHRADDISADLLKCIVGWGIKNVMTMTVDNAPRNDKAISYLIKKFPNARLYDDGKHFHVRCMAHILNLIVQEGLKVKNYHVESLSNAVRYIRQSTQRIKKFKACMKESSLESNRFLCGECPTRWNSKHDMLKIAVELRDVFFKYELVDDCYYRDLDRAPEHSDFGACKEIVEFLDKFKAKTELISSSSKPLAHLFFGEILDVDKHLRSWETKPDFRIMVQDMVDKYNKYWGKFDKLNDFMYFATILDPTMKQRLVSHGFKTMLIHKMSYEDTTDDDVLNDMVSEMVKKVVQRMEVLFKTYKTRFDTVGSKGSSQQTRNQESGNQEYSKAYGGDNDFVYDFLNLEESGSIESESELTRYLNEPRIRYTKDFDILEWWKLNAPRFPVVSRMAKDILPIQITTVAAESAFSTGGRVLDPYRTNLSYPVVEALICTQDSVRKSRKAIIDDIDDILNDDDVAREIEDGINKQNSQEKGKEGVEV
ncbi:zinc finger BED domain-containing protein RICESLEEPER 2 [Artemisia annua]|uniref:Zinc finger BED domain-containing protein RICESLEEPER 2 n=1 Tax=Artemisia annua TaxID=35608 RepID=A0A2U1M669_ARTAN|nr:zinc finger BED domain-containing protein RICESLEEPER 2 [Artemisia annua]